MSRILALIFAAVLLGVAGCGGGGNDSVDTSRETTSSADAHTGGDDKAVGAKGGEEKGEQESPAEGGQPGITIAAEDSDYGTILFDGNHQAIYLFEKESSQRSECYGDCAVAWPPVLTKGGPRSGAGVNSNLLGTTARTDGTTQVTYNGHPLYYYENDPQGQVLCQDVVEFGGRWLVVDPAGDAVQ